MFFQKIEEVKFPNIFCKPSIILKPQVEKDIQRKYRSIFLMNIETKVVVDYAN